MRIGTLKLGGLGDACDFAVILHGIRKQFPFSSIIAISDTGKSILQHYADAVWIDKEHTWHDLFKMHVWKYDLFYDLRPHAGLVYRGNVWNKSCRLIANNRLGHLDERVPVNVTLQHIERYNHYNSHYTGKLQMLEKSVIQLNCEAIGVQSDYDESRYDVPNKLHNHDFITVNIGAMGSERGLTQTKQWDFERWQEVTDVLLDRGEMVIQLGIRWEKKLKRVQHAWQKPILEVMRLLEASKLHLGNENGLVRLRRLVTNRPSIVLFGPTHPNMYGFDNNINIWKNVCHPCLWYTGNWMYKCAMDMDCICMKNITAKIVLDKYYEYCDNNKSTT